LRPSRQEGGESEEAPWHGGHSDATNSAIESAASKQQTTPNSESANSLWTLLSTYSLSEYASALESEGYTLQGLTLMQEHETLELFTALKFKAGQKLSFRALLQDLQAEKKFVSPKQPPEGFFLKDETVDLKALVTKTFQASWKKDDFLYKKTLNIWTIHNPVLKARFDARCQYLERQFENSHEELMFHGCSSQCAGVGCMSKQCAMCSIARDGFLLRRVRNDVWQRFGHGLYFAFDSSKSHEYPLGSLNPKGGVRQMLLCKVITGKRFLTTKNIPDLQRAPEGFDAVHGQAGVDLNYDELVVYDEASVLPWCIVSYAYTGR
jgi:hypothetical protein